MGKSSRASVTKKNNSALRKKVFGPVELARSERLSAKLLALVNEPKPPRKEMEIEQEVVKDATVDQKDEDLAMELDTTKQSKTGAKSSKQSGRIQKSRHRKARNEIAFKKHPLKSKKKNNRKS